MARARKRQRAEEVIPRAALAKEVARIIDDEGITQTEAAYRMHDAASQVSLVVTGNLRGFSSERLLRMLVGLGRDVDIVLRPRSSGQGKVRVTTK